MDARRHTDARGHGGAHTGRVTDGVGAALLDHQHGDVLGVGTAGDEGAAVLPLEALVVSPADAGVGHRLEGIVDARRSAGNREAAVVGLTVGAGDGRGRLAGLGRGLRLGGGRRLRRGRLDGGVGGGVCRLADGRGAAGRTLVALDLVGIGRRGLPHRDDRVPRPDELVGQDLRRGARREGLGREQESEHDGEDASLECRCVHGSASPVDGGAARRRPRNTEISLNIR